MERAQRLLKSTLCCDLHGCMPMRPTDHRFLHGLERYRAAGVGLVFINVGWDVFPIEDHIRMLAHLRDWVRRYPGQYTLATDWASVESAVAAGRLAVGFDIEGMNAIADQLSLIDLYRDLGVGWMAIAYNRNNGAGGGCQSEDSGLTPYGRQAIQEMARVGMIVCCSHTGKRTALEAIDLSANPVMFSHSNAAAVYPHPRNIDDEMIRACARRGGVIGINGIGAFLGENDNRTDTLIRHIDHVVQLVGPEHVAIGLDFVFDTDEMNTYVAQYPETYPPELYSGGIRLIEPERLTEIAGNLLARGYPEVAVTSILGGNVVRLAKRVWGAL